jgi:hypothetical protein
MQKDQTLAVKVRAVKVPDFTISLQFNAAATASAADTNHFTENTIMAKNKQTPPAKSTVPADDEDPLAQALCDLAIELVEGVDSESMKEALKQKEIDLHRIIRKSLQRKKDDTLHEALDLARYADGSAWQLLNERIEEASGVVVFRRDHGADLEINAFLVPIFVQTTGGLDREETFQDEEAFDLLRQSFKDAQLESRDATVVLVSHAYHLDEMDRIDYSDLNEMVREAYTTMTSKKVVATPAIDRSFSGWPASSFEPTDQALELRFLLGFALKATDDPFYQVPADEADADAYFEARGERFQRWTEQAAPLLARCLAKDHAGIEINFLYQDLFHGGKERGAAEYYTLQMMSELNHGLRQHGAEARDTKAIMGPAEVEDELVLRVNLYAEADGALLASSDKPMAAAGDFESEADDAYDALMTMGVKSLSLAVRFDAAGQPVDAQPYEV